MKLSAFNSLVGQDSYVRCQGKERIDPAIVSMEVAENHVLAGGTIGWWVRPGYIVVDIDEGQELALRLVKKMGLKTLMCKTNKGVHLYFKTDREYPQKIGMILPIGLKCDFRCANKGYVLLPYGTEGRSFNKSQDIVDMPIEWTPLSGKERTSLLGKREGDGRNAMLFSHLMAYKNKGASQEQIESLASTINEFIFEEPMSKEELGKIMDNTKKYKAQLQGDNPFLIYGSKGAPSQINARAICDYFVTEGNTFVLGGECYQYQDGVYVEASSRIRNNIKEMIGVDTLITQNKIMETFRLLLDDTRIQRKAADLNSDRNLINFKSGVWDVQQKTLLPHDSQYLQTIQIPHVVHESPPTWEKTRLYDFLVNKCSLLEEDIEMLLDYLAYCLTLDFGLKTFMMLKGQSNTGKSVLIRFVESLVGKENTSALSMHELNQRFYPAQLYNKLLNSCADNSALPLQSIESLKKITGGDMIMHEKKGKEPFFFVPFVKLIFSFNQVPLQLEEKSNAFYKRIRVLVMEKELFLDNEYVEALCDSTEEVLPHLLHRLPMNRIPNTEASLETVECMRRDSDSIHAFVTSECVRGKSRWVSKKALYDSYARFCIDAGREAHKKHTFIRHIRSLNFQEARHPKTREACWKGVALKRSVREK